MKKEEAPYQCHYCHKRFQRESNFIKHKCKQMEREEKLRTALGQAAWQYYQDWMRLQRKRVPDDRTFLKSQYYNSFNRFAEFVKKLSLPSPDTFIKLMIDNDFPPTLWTRDEVYARYLEHLDRSVSPKQLAEITAQTLDKLADILECDISEVFEELHPNEAIELIKQRKLSPWILLNSQKFFVFLQKVNKENMEQFIILEAVIRPKYWGEQFQKKPKVVKFMKTIVDGLDL